MSPLMLVTCLISSGHGFLETARVDHAAGLFGCSDRSEPDTAGVLFRAAGGSFAAEHAGGFLARKVEESEVGFFFARIEAAPVLPPAVAPRAQGPT